MVGIEPGKTELLPYDSQYKFIAESTIKQLENIFSNLAVKIEHVGSTAIIGIKSKPIIDIAVGVRSFDIIDSLKDSLEKNGFIFSKTKLNNTIIDYKCENGEKRTHNIHIVIFGGERWQEFIVFRDYLNSHPETAREYENLKLELSNKYKDDIHEYTEHKSTFVLDILNKALKL